MTLSVNTNKSALIALQNLNKTSDELGKAEDRISTSLAISGAKDNASIWSIAQDQRADVSSLGSVRMSLNRAQSISDVAMAAGESVSNLLNQMREKVIAAMETSIGSSARKALDDDFQGLLSQLGQVVANASFDGSNILNASLSQSLRFLADADAVLAVTLSLQDLTVGGPNVTVPAGSSILTPADATAVLAQLDVSIQSTNGAVATVGSQAKRIEAHMVFISKLSDTLEAGVGNLVDADMAKESARLQALQVQQQLGVQALSIANGAPQVILSLFQGQ